jgi:hypothetical protein
MFRLLNFGVLVVLVYFGLQFAFPDEFAKKKSNVAPFSPLSARQSSDKSPASGPRILPLHKSGEGLLLERSEGRLKLREGPVRRALKRPQ